MKNHLVNFNPRLETRRPRTMRTSERQKPRGPLGGALPPRALNDSLKMETPLRLIQRTLRHFKEPWCVPDWKETTTGQGAMHQSLKSFPDDRDQTKPFPRKRDYQAIQPSAHGCEGPWIRKPYAHQHTAAIFGRLHVLKSCQDRTLTLSCSKEQRAPGAH